MTRALVSACWLILVLAIIQNPATVGEWWAKASRSYLAEMVK